MFSDESHKNLLNMIEDALRDNLSVDSINFYSSDESAPLEKEDMILLTISSYSFRLIMFFHYTLDDKTRAFIRSQLTQYNEKNSDQEKEKQYLDYLSELSNGYCGQLKRVMGEQFPHLGMSTPNQLDKNNYAFVHDLGCQVRNQKQIKINSDVNFFISYCLSFKDGQDFVIHAAHKDESESGELEFF